MRGVDGVAEPTGEVTLARIRSGLVVVKLHHDGAAMSAGIRGASLLAGAQVDARLVRLPRRAWRAVAVVAVEPPLVPTWLKAVESATLEAASSGTRGGGWVPGG